MSQDFLKPLALLLVNVAPCRACSSMKSFASLRSMAAEWRKRKGYWRCHFKEQLARIEYGDGNLFKPMVDITDSVFEL